jgi:dnd system-associated protein 4
MAERRVYIDKNLVDFVKILADSDSEKRVFNNMAQCLAFAAAYGFKNNSRLKIERASTKEVEPINFQYFENSNVESLFVLLSLATETDYKKALSDSEESSELRVSTFEEYAKGGLTLLKKELSGLIGYLDPTVENMLKSKNINKGVDGFDPSELKIE